ncbi:MAG: transglutaminase family protein [Paludisphaera borealis]|uniref:transglutaminase-like domain-containing protein n=1 Tax=Paludisphaera borealis TaxID=1387353 RepID=UPI00284199B5|nr:transglutaminase family protein [Paludisphaera borealis]MDR3620309.1 transglutaminase family protein [Paludisphaera borealis]
MYIRIGYDIVFDVPTPIPMLMLLRVHPSVEPSLQNPEALVIEPEVGASDYIDSFGNRVRRILAPAGSLKLTNDAVVAVDGLPDPVHPDAREHPVAELPTEVIQFLLASRYCEVDRLGEAAWDLFGKTPRGWGRVQAVVDWVHGHIEFGYQHARSTKTAYDAFVEAKGVCRDFTHLAVTFCRCLNIPARYATGYLGDIGVPAVPDPMDFSAWFEVFLGGRWHTFDARHNTPRIGRIVMARGRDATDVALTTSFGPTSLQKFVVWTDEVTDAGGATKVA